MRPGLSGQPCFRKFPRLEGHGGMIGSKWQPRLYALFLGAIATALIAGGSYLVLLGGSVYYAIAGLALAAVVVLLWLQRREALLVYGCIVVVTVIWSLWEAGLDGWALMPRIAAWLVVGAWMATPIFRRSLLPAPATRIRGLPLFSWRFAALAGVFAIGLGTALQPLRSEAEDPRFQAGTGPFPDRRMAASLTSGTDWQHWGNDRGGSRYSTIEQITPANVAGLELVWSAPLAESEEGRNAGLAATPLMVGDTLYLCNNVNEVFAIDAETGDRRWVHPAEGAPGRTCRGVAYHAVPGGTGLCAERILTATNTAKLIALDAATGQLCPGFGNNGRVNLLDGMSDAPEGYYHVSSAPAIVRGNIVLGGWVTDGQFWGEPSGVIRAFDAVTGELSWAWDMGAPDRTGAPPAGETYTHSTPNSWAPISADEELGLVYLPTGNATPDYFGGQRRDFDNQFSSSVVALDAETGRLRWSFQTTHLDIWDYDVASQPTLVDLPQADGTVVPALLQLTKRGEMFVLNRVTGEPVHRVEERPVPQAGHVPDDRLSPTQPFSPGLPSFRNADIRESDMWGLTPLDQLWCRIRFRSLRYEGTLTPPGLTPMLFSPGYVGGMNWGSGSVDPERGIVVFNSMNLAVTGQLIPREEADRLGMKPVGGGSTGLEVGGDSAMLGTPYGMIREAFLSPLQAPCQEPPYGYLSAVDLVTGKLVWSHPYGETMGLTMGTPIIGGSITTRSGLVFMGGSIDAMFRALDQRTGEELWRAALPRGAHAIPATYLSPESGRQFVVIAVGGNPGFGSQGDARLMAYALPHGR
jgi:quinoprotein glucose dehydrogenase